MSWYEITALGMIAGVVGTGTGGLFSIFIKKPTPRFTGTILAFAAGIMLSIVFLELIFESIEQSGTGAALAGLSGGMLIFYLLDHYLPHHHTITEEKTHLGSYLKKGTLLALGIALHNFPEGLAIGSGFVGSTEIGLALVFLIGLHNIPEGMAVAAPLSQAGYSYGKVIAIAALSGAPMGIGALAGALIGGISVFILALSLGFAAGAMLYIVCDELIPDAYESAGAHLSILGIFTGTFLGILFTEWF
ncbi:MAG TPA: ZIP family metal transporter [Firmicutes bacterium]|nr:ZIP family metal transporter [Bacillota bacterium]